MIHLKIMLYGILVTAFLTIASVIMYACGHVISKIMGWSEDPAEKWVIGLLFTAALGAIYAMGALAYYG